MSHSKTHYQGMNLQRVHRSEFDDAKLRDLARQDAKLGQNLKTVERARQVMMKSMDADKQLFIKAGAQANSKLTRSTQGAHPRPGNPTSSHQLTRSAPDSKVKRTNFKDQSKTEELSENRGITEKSSSLDQDKEHSSLVLCDTASFYDSFLETTSSNLSKSSSSNYDTRPTKLSANSGFGCGARGVTGISETDRTTLELIPNKTTNLTSKGMTDGTRPGKSAWRKDDKPYHSSLCHNGLDNEVRSGSVDKLDSSAVCLGATHTGEQEQVDIEPGKRAKIWDMLSIPKHMSMSKSKRSQIEKEFASPGLKSSSSSPALLLSTKSAMSARGRTDITHRQTPQTGSHSGRSLEATKGK